MKGGRSKSRKEFPFLVGGHNLRFVLFATENSVGGAAITFDWTLKYFGFLLLKRDLCDSP